MHIHIRTFAKKMPPEGIDHETSHPCSPDACATYKMGRGERPPIFSDPKGNGDPEILDVSKFRQNPKIQKPQKRRKK